MKSSPEKEENPASGVETLDVLFIDDSENLCRAMELWLKASGYSTRTALSGAQAVETAILERPRVIITDIGLPDFSGHELRLRLLDTPGLEETRFIALSGRRGKGDPRRAIESGFDAFIAKPPNFEELSLALRECLSDRARGE